MVNIYYNIDIFVSLENNENYVDKYLYKVEFNIYYPYDYFP